MENIRIQQWDEERFFRSKNEWNELLEKSDSDQLFLSWEWQSTWWKVFSEPGMELRLYTATDADGTLVGIAPLYLTTVSTKKIIKSKCMQFIGNCWRGKSTMLTELLGFITLESHSKDVIRAMYSHIASNGDWDEFILPFLNTQAETYKLLVEEDLLPRCYPRHIEEYKSYYLDIHGNFEDYTKNLGKNTRLKFINRRKMFQELGDISFTRMMSTDIDECFNLLNNLHSKRWEKPIFKGERLDFNLTVASLFAERNCLNFSILSLDKEPVSIQYNFVINGHNYNIQAGFDETFHKKISLGYLHFGYEIEASFTEHYTAYDFLAGEGKNTQYKERLTDSYLQMTDLHIVRRPSLKILYKLFDWVNSIRGHG